MSSSHSSSNDSKHRNFDSVTEPSTNSKNSCHTLPHPPSGTNPVTQEKSTTPAATGNTSTCSTKLKTKDSMTVETASDKSHTQASLIAACNVPTGKDRTVVVNTDVSVVPAILDLITHEHDVQFIFNVLFDKESMQKRKNGGVYPLLSRAVHQRSIP